MSHFRFVRSKTPTKNPWDSGACAPEKGARSLFAMLPYSQRSTAGRGWKSHPKWALSVPARRLRALCPRGLALLAATVAPFLPETAAAQCAMCRTALISSPEGQQMAASFNQGILFLLGAPFAVVAAIALLIFRARRDASRAEGRPAAGAAEPGSSAICGQAGKPDNFQFTI